MNKANADKATPKQRRNERETMNQRAKKSERCSRVRGRSSGRVQSAIDKGKTACYPCVSDLGFGNVPGESARRKKKIGYGQPVAL